ncbi:hypothetical protein GMOD_00010319 [Pyrenophora seminiperda CCB06]|uniref:Uncharacterized protein n=1 Tax=Pyrenophora seminiperda CCB06 TaxID=1302712 RepID=A0A3M7M5I2_9PLEO|nr:hypothetical protein GMOD_00010319 [Pyrenophora seminiperda CCB06]
MFMDDWFVTCGAFNLSLSRAKSFYYSDLAISSKALDTPYYPPTHIPKDPRCLKQCVSTHPCTDHHHGRVYATHLPPLGLFNASLPASGVLLHAWLIRWLLHHDIPRIHESG